MDCERSLNLISARLDHEIGPDDLTWLDTHLAECADCRATAASFALQHEDLRSEFAPRRVAVAATAAQVAGRVPSRPAPTPPTLPPGRLSRLGQGIGAVVALATLVLILVLLNRYRPSPRGTPPLIDDPVVVGPRQVQPLAGPEISLLTPRPRPKAPDLTALAVGASIKTPAGQRQRLALPDRSVLYVDQNTTLTLESEHAFSVASGTVYVESASGTSALNVTTPARRVASAGRFAVRALDKATEVLVTVGVAHVQNVSAPWEGDVQAGQFLSGSATQTEPAPRASYLLEWTRDLMAAAETPLVPSSRYAGGSLLAVDANGQEARLGLRNFTVDVHIEDGFARTTIDQTYFNHHPFRLEGTFFFPLPADASLSRLAMYVNGDLMEGGMAERDYARAVYQRIVNNQRDPALLEWVDGTTFKMRVFPLEGRQEKRIILSYTQRLPTLYGRTSYRFPSGHSLQMVDKWRFRATVKGGKASGLVFRSSSHPSLHDVSAFPSEVGLQEEKDEPGDLRLFDEVRNVKADRDVVLELEEPAAAAASQARFATAEHEGATYLMARYRPELTGQPVRQRRDWVFLFEASADRDPLLARTQLDVVRHLLANANSEDTFMVLTANSRVHFFQPAPVKVTPDNVTAAVAFLERTHLVGALDLGSALGEAGKALKQGANPYLVHLGSGLTSLGTQQQRLLDRLPNCPYVGIGVGKRWSRDWMKQAAEKTGGHFTQVNPDEPVAWRAFELMATLDTPRLLETVVEAEGGASVSFLTETTTVCQGEELFAVARLTGPAPAAVVVRGRVNGADFRRVVPVREVKTGAGYLPRTWAKLEIERLLADRQNHKEAVVKLSKDMYVMTPYTSLLVLENEAMYAEFKVDRGRKDHWAMYALQAKVPVKEPEYDPTMPADVRNAPRGLKPAPSTVLQSVAVRVPASFVRANESGRPISGQGLGIWDETAPLSSNSQANHFAELRDIKQRRVSLEALGDKDDKARQLFSFYASNDRYMRGEGLPEAADGAPTSPMPVSLALQKRSEPSLDFGFRHVSGLSKDVEFENATGVSIEFPANRPPMPSRLPALRNAESKLGRLNIDAIRLSPDGRRLSTAGLQAVDINGLDESFGGDLSDPIWDGTTGRSAHGPYRGLTNLGVGRTGGADAFPLLYEPQAATRDNRLFTDLVSYAPGLNTSSADRQAVVETEAAPDLRSAPGHIDPAARDLLEGARRGGWQQLTLSGGSILRFDGAGRYTWTRTLPLGLHEQVICDGVTLWHLYPELGLVARRTVSRFHRAELLSMLPWLAPPAEDLARGANVKLIDPQTIAIVPNIPEEASTETPRVTYQLRLVFADGRLAERRLVELPGDKMLRREVFDGKGGVRVFAADGKEQASLTVALQPTEAPDLVPETEGLVVLPLPLRSSQYVFEKFGLEPSQDLHSEANSWFRCLDREAATELLTAALAQGNAEQAKQVFRTCFAAHGDQRLGLYVVLAACGVDVSAEPAFEHHLTGQTTPLARYLMLVTGNSDGWLQHQFPLHAGSVTTTGDGWLRSLLLHASGSQARSENPLTRMAVKALERSTPPGDFLHQLAELRDLSRRWEAEPNPLTPLWRAEDLRRSLAYVLAHRHTAAGRTLLLTIQAHAQHQPARWRALAAAWGVLGSDGDYRARYEQACCLLEAGDRAAARAHFLALYEDTLACGVLPPLDRRCRNALEEEDTTKDGWAPLLRGTATHLVEKKNRPAAVALALQASRLHDPLLADNLLTIALAGDMDKEEKTEVSLAAMEYLVQTEQPARAETLVTELLATYPKKPGLWRLASGLADKRGQQARAITCLEEALDLEYNSLPDVIALEGWRGDYGKLLGFYLEQARALNDVNGTPPADLAVRTVRAVDRWRAHDPEPGDGPQTAAATLALLGQRDLAWDYHTTPFAGSAGAERSLPTLAGSLAREGHYDLAQRAYATACAAEPSDGQLTWDRAQMLRQAGRAAEGDQLLKALVEDKEVSATLRARVRWQLGERSKP